MVRVTTLPARSRSPSSRKERITFWALSNAAKRAKARFLLDYAMPRMDGAEISRQLRADRSTAAIPIILMSASDPMARPRMTVDGELRKPFDLEAMAAVVARWTDTPYRHATDPDGL